MNILIVEDIEEQREALKKIIQEEFEDITVYSVKSLKKAMEIINKENIDLFLLDVNLVDGTGIELAEKIRVKPGYKLTPIVFVTIEANRMLDAFKNIHCYDFLLKPYEKEEIINIVSTFLKAKNDAKENDNPSSIFNISSKISVKIYHKDIIFIEYYLRKCRIHTIKGKYEVKVNGLAKIIEEINFKDIVQSHKSYAINLNYIDKIEKVYPKLWNIYFNNYKEAAKLGYKYKNNIYIKAN
ncbi:LytR/AlgR family response regulator transcription factor [Clostridium chauvoei]|uniref:Stage 0 sporulation protein A homolog n=2 Tax=Clostridium chauvoei TaxID=46867 RepID=S6EN00_9CLOT|nr:LytTR family DNA-binding domain-containing protein [Clostridium chauvoei]ATD54088.1 hypothetical protein BTM20_02075 [Clostridium chauvoei]ATD58461.1 hypothetical protein BTM21_12375 [Clostridium chauvoei]MBX7281599.1 LytTR family DNA-binding domain-containing protein [Clostridium chauvoei]MBX7284119.1 LytTR family DNA-binding domain-containing protein [Clostridium chauvoei]MBX7286633.1 LytTR family DNA-binding domain-containing protein [Clostridium chauvoei]